MRKLTGYFFVIFISLSVVNSCAHVALAQCCSCSYVTPELCSQNGCQHNQCGTVCICTQCNDPAITGYCFTDADCPSGKKCEGGQGPPACVVGLCKVPTPTPDPNATPTPTSTPVPTATPRPYLGRCSTQNGVWQNCNALCSSDSSCQVIPSGYTSVACPICVASNCDPTSGKTDNCGSPCNKDSDCNTPSSNVCDRCLPW